MKKTGRTLSRSALQQVPLATIPVAACSAEDPFCLCHWGPLNPSNSCRFPTAFMAVDPITPPAWTPAAYSAAFTDSFCLRLTSSRCCHGCPEERGCCTPFRTSCCVALELGRPVLQPPARPLRSHGCSACSCISDPGSVVATLQALA